ncbi:MAG: DNA topoisomerase VI subunit B [Candidatus Thorarchaeota archaeon]
MLSSTFSQPEITELSISAWFYRNRTLAGFDNPARSLYVSIRELVENSLDACEAVGILPEINVKLSAINQKDQINLATSGSGIFRLVVQDNGSGIRRKDVPKLIGKMLTGTKFTHKQSRGTFGLGGSLALLYGQVTTQKPIEIVTGITGEDVFHSMKMQLDVEKNETDIISEIDLPKTPINHGTTISFCLQGDWLRSKRRILDYFSKTSLIVPYSSIWFQTPDKDLLEFERVIETLPPSPKEVKPHPHGTDIEMLKYMIRNSRSGNLKSFLINSFQRIGQSTSDAFLLYAGLNSETQPKDLSNEDLLELINALSTFDGFMIPTSRALSPAGQKAFRAGIQRLEPEFIATSIRSPSVYQGHPFVIEIGAAYGGNLANGVNLYRFANRIPLLYDEGSDVSSRVIKELNMKAYGFGMEDPLSLFVHLCSTKVPFKTVGKEYIADVDEIRREIELGMKDCLRRLSEQVKRRHRIHSSIKRENRLRSYYQFISEILEESASKKVNLSELFPEEVE